METTNKISRQSNTLFPVFLKLEQLDVLVVGGGPVGLEKIRALSDNCPMARISLVAIQVLPELVLLQKEIPGLSIYQRAFEASDLGGRDLVFLATADTILNRQITELARARKILTNVADTPELCDFYLGSIVRKGDLKIAISTNGKSPTLAKRLKEYLQEDLPDELERVLDQLHQIRKRLQGAFSERVRRLERITSVLSRKLSKEENPAGNTEPKESGS